MRENQLIDIRSSDYKGSYRVAIGALIILTAFSVFFYKQRMYFIDPTWICFRIINDGTFCFAEHRYGAFITQLFPLICSYLGVPLKVMLVLYSVSFYLFFTGAALIIGSVWKQKWLSILLVLYLTLLVSDTYYWPNNEVHQGITWMALFLAYYIRNIQKGDIKPLSHLLLVLFAILAICSHLLVALPFLFLWIYIHVNGSKGIKGLYKDRNFLVYSLLLIGFMVIRYVLSHNGSYDADKLGPVRGIGIASILKSFHSGQSATFLELLLKNYWILIPIILCGYLYLFRAKQYLSVILTSVFMLAYYLLICITFPDAYGRNLLFYMESEWMGLAAIASTPFVIWLSGARLKRVAFPVLLLVLAIRMGYIFNSFSFFNERYLRLQTITYNLNQKEMDKALIVQSQNVTDSLFIMGWGLPVESLMLSSAEHMDRNTTFKAVLPEFEISKEKDVFISSFSIDPISALNKRYFNPDTSRHYQVIHNIRPFLEDRDIP